MKLYKQVIALFFLFLALPSCSHKETLQWIPFIWEGDTISGRYIEKAFLYVPVEIEDLPYDFTMQFDLGTYTSVFYGNSITPYLEESQSLVDKIDSTGMYRGVRLRMGAVEINNANIGHMNNFGEKIPVDSLHTGTPKHVGTIASDMVQGKILVIDYASQRLAIADCVPAEYEDLPAGKFELTDGPVKLPFRIDGKEYKLMFDTGSSPFQLVTTKERALAISDPAIVDSLSGPLWWGTEVAFCGLNVNKTIELGGQVLEDSKVYYEKNGLWDGVYKSLDVWGITGNAYFYDRILILDYKNKVFRVK